MIDLRRLRTEPDVVRAGIARRGVDLSGLDRVIALDVEQRQVAQERDEARAEINAISKQIGELHRAGRRDEAGELQGTSRALGEREKQLAARAEDLGAAIRHELLTIPNIPAEQAPDGPDDSANPELRRAGPVPESFAEHQRVPHWETGAELGILDLERGAKLSGSMFAMFRGGGAALVRALIQFGLDRNADAFEEVRPPTLVRTETLVATGHLPKFSDDAYQVERDDLWAIPTAEVPLTSLARDEILDESQLPWRLMAYTPCYRREAGSAGRDTRGLLRVHEFDKVEILAYATEAQAPELLDELVERAEGAIADLGLTYRIIEICTGDMGQSHHRSFDIEVYSPGVDLWLEVSSISWFSDYQARRANIRYRPGDSNQTRFVHTLNGSALAVPRVWAALVETYRRADGQVDVPEVLRPYLGGRELLSGGPSR
ncbi:MAG: serine--tRNA ligase [Acidimicrobiia bacterium]|nr:serine--tRNA ligase [Acidimicrobiia bacterium]